MPTSHAAFVEVARRAGVDPRDDNAVNHFYKEVVPGLPQQEQEGILHALLELDGLLKVPNEIELIMLRRLAETAEMLSQIKSSQVKLESLVNDVDRRTRRLEQTLIAATNRSEPEAAVERRLRVEKHRA
jgi:hypothetical protein